MTVKPLSFANICWIDDQHAINKDANDRYFSDDPVAESNYVYLQGNDLATRWQQSHGEIFTILELGYGTGLNFLLTQKLWSESCQANRNNYQQLNYISIDRSPIKSQDLKKFYKGWPELEKNSRHLLNQLPMPTPGCHLIDLSAKECVHPVNLFIHYAEAEMALEDLIQNENCRVDAIYLDGFSPSKNSSLWTCSIFSQLAKLSHATTTATSFSASSVVKRNLTASNFNVKKRAGFAQKREMIVASFNQGNTGNRHQRTGTKEQKLTASNSHQPPAKILVIGAGLAGIITASKLSSRGYQVDVMEANDVPCKEASGNALGLSYPKLSNVYDSSCSLHCCAFDYLSREIHRHEIPSGGKNHHASKGLIYLLQKNKTRMHAHTAEKLNIPEEHIRYLNEQQTAAFLSTSVKSDSLLFAKARALSPKLMASQYLSADYHEKNINFYFNTFVEKLIRHNNQWHVLSEGSTWGNYQSVFICCGHLLKHLLPQYSPYTDQVKGQIDHFISRQQLPKSPICGNGYVIPEQHSNNCASNKRQNLWVGASFHRNTSNNQISLTDSQENLTRASQLLNMSENNFQWLESRASTRLTTSDRLPLTGKICYEESSNIDLQQSNTLNATSKLPNIFINTAFGSHGLTLIPLLSEYIVRLFNHELLPVSRLLMNAVDPERFVLRAQKHKK